MAEDGEAREHDHNSRVRVVDMLFAIDQQKEATP